MKFLLLMVIFLSFISLGLPDAALGAAWPVMYQDLATSISAAGTIAFIVTIGTIISSLSSGVILRRFGTGRVNLFSTLLTGLSLLGYSMAPSLTWILLFAIPLGLGAGSVDAGLNSFVALHYDAHHMNWLHSFWGLGASMSPIILAKMIEQTGNWRTGYLIIASIQLILAVILFGTLPIWKRVEYKYLAVHVETEDIEITTSGEGIALIKNLADDAENTQFKSNADDFPSHKKPILLLAQLSFLLYCGAEVAIGLWGVSYLVNIRQLTVNKASIWVACYFAGITFGRIITGFLTFRWATQVLVRTGIIISLIGALMIQMTHTPLPGLIGFILVGIGFAPVFPGMVHETPNRFGKHHSQNIIGIQMASAYVGMILFPPAIGWIAVNYSLKALILIVILAVLTLLVCTEIINKKVNPYVS